VKRRHYDYAVGDEVLVKEDKPNKLSPRLHGPYRITRVHINGTLTIQLRLHVTDRLNIRRIVPYLRH